VENERTNQCQHFNTQVLQEVTLAVHEFAKQRGPINGLQHKNAVLGIAWTVCVSFNFAVSGWMTNELKRMWTVSILV
jgi:isoprenylcysteine carboxyl methyltransferase (ICMT) family protein YpbQ